MKALELMSGQVAKQITRNFVKDLLLNSGLKSELVMEVSPGNKPILAKTDFQKLLYVDYFDTFGVHANNNLNYGYGAKNFMEIDIALSQDPDLRSVRDDSVKAIASSHVLEHLPNPIGHLMTMERILQTDGVYVFIVPDKYCCFDVFRQPTDIGAWVAAYRYGQRKPQLSQHLDSLVRAVFDRTGGVHKQHRHTLHGQLVSDSNFGFSVEQGYVDALEKVQRQETSDYYGDTHVWVFTPATLHLLFVECNLLGLTRLWPIHRSGVLGEEFVIILQKGAGAAFAESEKESLRLRLCQEIFL